jgi:hypothetical protein
VDWIRKLFRRESTPASPAPEAAPLNPLAAEPALPGARDQQANVADESGALHEGDEPKEPRSL